MTQSPTWAEPLAGTAGQRRRRGRWDDAPLRFKMILLTIIGVLGGAAVGLIEARLGHLVWPFCVGITLLVTAILWLGGRWIVGPIERLTEMAGDLERRNQRPDDATIASLHLLGKDEVGRLSQMLYRIAAAGWRGRNETARLRRTLDHRVTRATDLATRKLKLETMRDPLTGLGNRRFLEQHLEPLFEAARQEGSDLICLMVDLDNFKRANDLLGHAVGDKLLTFLGSIIGAATRPKDYGIRLGGDEFVILMPGCTIRRAADMARQLRALMVHHTHTSLGGEVSVDLSIGLASAARDKVTSGRELLEKADAHLYTAKRHGKGQLVGDG